MCVSWPSAVSCRVYTLVVRCRNSIKSVFIISLWEIIIIILCFIYFYYIPTYAHTHANRSCMHFQCSNIYYTLNSKCWVITLGSNLFVITIPLYVHMYICIVYSYMVYVYVCLCHCRLHTCICMCTSCCYCFEIITYLSYIQ